MVVTSDYERHWENRRTRARTAGDEARESYYGLPVIHKAHWDWWIIVYFFVGGISGASNAIAAIAGWRGGKEGQSIARVGRYLSFAMLIPSVICLILDLGRPERFLKMLRVIKFRSPMSLGTWVLLSSSAFISLLTLEQLRKDGLLKGMPLVDRMMTRLPMRLFDVLGVIPSLLLAGYTGVLLAATAVPLWTRNHLLMGPLFLASAFSNASAAIAIILGLRRSSSIEAKHRVERLDVIAMVAELVLIVVFKQRLSKTVARPLEEGTTGKLHRFGVLGAGIGLPLLLHGSSMVRGKSPSKPVSLIASLLVLIGGLAFRYVMVMGGHRSADDPQATFEMTRRSPS